MNETSRVRGHDYVTIAAVSVDVSQADIRGVAEQKCDPHVKGLPWALLMRQWCTNVMHSKGESMKPVASMVRKHLEGIVA